MKKRYLHARMVSRYHENNGRCYNRRIISNAWNLQETTDFCTCTFITNTNTNEEYEYEFAKLGLTER